jgi:hypothetical protein
MGRDTTRIPTASAAAGVAGAAGLTAGILAWLCRRRRAAGGCDPTVGAWPGPPQWSSDGMLTNVAAFVAFVTAEEPCWRGYPIASALAVIGVDPGSAYPEDPVLVESGPSAGSGEVDVRLTYEVTDDDSVAGIRYLLTFVDEAFLGGTAGVYRLVAGLRELRCLPGRGQQDWGTDLCL